jgi:hypothetical protein
MPDIKLPENWQQIALVIVAAVFLWLRTSGANPTLDAIRKALGSLLAWPESDPLKSLDAETPEGDGARAAVLARIRLRLAKHADAASLKRFDAIAEQIQKGGE